MNDQDITVIITSFHSGEKIFNCIESINKDVKIIVIENSNDQELKKKIQSKYKKCRLYLIKGEFRLWSRKQSGLIKGPD